MKIRSIELTNVRRFEGRTAVICDIADGVTTICEPNESGKSTFFDALQVALLVDHKSMAAQVKSLQPYSKGSVEIAVEVEAEGRRFRIEKRYLTKKSATIIELPAGRIIAQEGEAETWISNLLGGDIEGPAGLLWVRQGMSGFGPDGTGPAEKRERDKLRDARQTLMSSVAGQIDSVTGGRKMDAIMKSVEADIEAIATKAGAPKASGEWGKVSQKLQELRTERSQLEGQLTELRDALSERSDLKDRLRKQEDPKADSEREKSILAARERIEEARQYVRLIEGAERDKKLALLEIEGIKARRGSLEDLVARVSHAQRDLDRHCLAAQEDDASLTDANAALVQAKVRLDAAREILEGIRAKLARHQSLAASRHAAKSLSDARRRLERAQGFAQAVTAAREVQTQYLVTGAKLSGLEAVFSKLSAIQGARDRSAPYVSFAYTGTTRAKIEGASIEPGEKILVRGPLSIEIPGLGAIAVSPGASQDADGAEVRLTDQMAEMLSGLCVDSMETARRQAVLRSEAEQAERVAAASLEAIVPEGLDRLRAQIAELEAAVSATSEDENYSDEELGLLERQLGDAAASEANLKSDWECALDAQQELLRSMAGHNASVSHARTALEEAQARLGEDVEQRLAQIEVEIEKACETLRRAEESEAALKATAPDMEMLEADLSRLVSAKENLQRQKQEMQSRIHQLDGLIGARADDGVEERYHTVSGQIDRLEQRDARYALEVRSLFELRSALEVARREARDVYFEPIKAELGPLLSVLHTNAQIEMDSDTMLPSRLLRGDMEDSLEALSGGAAEQIAILTRLAFARLFAKAGRAVPVILDDAMVYSDDDRIVRMFTALTRISKDQQIIVFSCRNKAFEELGGHRPRISLKEPAAA